MPENQVYLNGRLIPAGQAAISVFDSGFLHGASTFTTMLAHNGRVFRLERHLARLMDTVRMLNLATDATPETLAPAVGQVLEANELKNARIRITITPGSVRGGGPTTLVTAEPLTGMPDAWYEKGIAVVVSTFKQMPGDLTFGYKTGCYLPRIMGRQEAAAKGVEEALWFTIDNHLAEACFNNIFLVLDGKVHTPPLDTPVLPGIVREAVLELCRQLEIPCDDSMPLTVDELLKAQEVFLTGSTSGIRPVVRVERHAVADEKPGPVTKRLMAAYRELLDKECPPGS